MNEAVKVIIDSGFWWGLFSWWCFLVFSVVDVPFWSCLSHTTDFIYISFIYESHTHIWLTGKKVSSRSLESCILILKYFYIVNNFTIRVFSHHSKTFLGLFTNPLKLFSVFHNLAFRFMYKLSGLCIIIKKMLWCPLIEGWWMLQDYMKNDECSAMGENWWLFKWQDCMINDEEGAKIKDDCSIQRTVWWLFC